MASFGEGLGSFIGASSGREDLSAGAKAVAGSADAFREGTEPYNQFGQSFMPHAWQGVADERNFAGSTLGYQDFMDRYETTPGARYEIEQGQEAQNNSAAARGQLLSGTNQRALLDISQRIASTRANEAYQSYLTGRNTQFGQLETSLGNMFKAIGVGQTATGQQAGVTGAEMGATASLAKSQAENSRAKGSGLGSIFGGIGSLAAAF